MDAFTFPTIYGIEKNGKTKVWNASIKVEKNGNAISTITYGQIDGKQQTTERVYTEGKNKGKANETTPYQQCKLETERKWKDKVEKENYTEEGSAPAADNKIFPMLAATYSVDSKKRNDIVFPCFVQPKLDGLRCIMYMRHGKVLAQSRTGSYFETLAYLTDAMTELFSANPDVVLDGELYTMDIPFETLAGLLKKKHVTDEDRATLQKYVQYHVYDMVSEQPFSDRIDTIQRMVFPPYVKIVPTVEVDSVDTFRRFFSSFVEQGFEGIMLRNGNGLYKTGYRSHDLQKYKEFHEEEYPIVGFEDGEGRDKECVIWICTTNGKEFRVRPRGTMEQRREWFQKGKTYIGKKLTVIFQELSEQHIPRFPVGKAIRDGY